MDIIQVWSLSKCPKDVSLYSCFLYIQVQEQVFLFQKHFIYYNNRVIKTRCFVMNSNLTHCMAHSVCFHYYQLPYTSSSLPILGCSERTRTPFRSKQLREGSFWALSLSVWCKLVCPAQYNTWPGTGCQVFITYSYPCFFQASSRIYIIIVCFIISISPYIIIILSHSVINIICSWHSIVK